jgi:hypothetical protein
MLTTMIGTSRADRALTGDLQTTFLIIVSYRFSSAC